MTAVTLFPIWWTVTRRIGFTAYSATSLGCLSFWLRSRNTWPPARLGFARLALTAAAIEFLLALDMIFEWRIALHNLSADMFMKYNLYQGRHSLQIALLCVLGSLLLIFLLYFFRRFRSHKGCLLAVSALSVSLALWLTEIISLHETDSNLYHLVNGIMVIAFLWVAVCLLTLLGVGMEARFSAREGRLRE